MAGWGGTPVYKGHDNEVVYELYADVVTEEPFDLGVTHKIAVYMGDESYADSDTNPDAVQSELREDGVWLARIKLGLVPAIATGDYDLRVVVFTAANPNGVVMLDGARAVVRE